MVISTFYFLINIGLFISVLIFMSIENYFISPFVVIFSFGQKIKPIRPLSCIICWDFLCHLVINLSGFCKFISTRCSFCHLKICVPLFLFPWNNHLFWKCEICPTLIADLSLYLCTSFCFCFIFSNATFFRAQLLHHLGRFFFNNMNSSVHSLMYPLWLKMTHESHHKF